MKLDFHQRACALQQYGCICCGAGCRSFLVPVRPDERAAIEKLADWRRELDAEQLWVKHRAAGPSRYGLAKRPDGACVFLDSDNLCAIHRRFGLQAKPLACQLYPFVLTPFAGGLRVGLRFDCTAVVRNEGKLLTEHRRELNRLAEKLVPPGALQAPIPPLLRNVRLSAGQLDAINEMLIGMVAADLPLAVRLHWLRRFLGTLSRVKWRQLTEDDFPVMMAMLRDGALAEAKRDGSTAPHPPTGKPRKLLGQMIFLLCQPTTIITHSAGASAGVTLWSRIRARAAQVKAMRQLGATSGPLPPVRPEWPALDLADIEAPFPAWPPEVADMLARYLTCRLTGMNYFGPNFYGYSLVEGAHSLLLAVVAVAWLMRVAALGEGRRDIRLADAHYAVRAVDGNLGYSAALAQGPARWRLAYLTPALETFIDYYAGSTPTPQARKETP